LNRIFAMALGLVSCIALVSPADAFEVRGIDVHAEEDDLGADEIEIIVRLIESLPEDHLEGLKRLTIPPKGAAPDIPAFPGQGPQIEAAVDGLHDRPTWRAVFEIGRHVYRSVLTSDERASFVALWDMDRRSEAYERLFGLLYMMHVVDSWPGVIEVPGDIQTRLSEAFARQWLPALFAASCFVDGRTGTIQVYRWSNQDFRVVHRTAVREGAWLTIGPIHYRLEDGRLIGAAIGDVHARPPSIAREQRWSGAIPVPEPILSRFKRRD
jgi:hypothetical protein